MGNLRVCQRPRHKTMIYIVGLMSVYYAIKIPPEFTQHYLSHIIQCYRSYLQLLLAERTPFNSVTSEIRIAQIRLQRV